MTAISRRGLLVAGGSGIGLLGLSGVHASLPLAGPSPALLLIDWSVEPLNPAPPGGGGSVADGGGGRRRTVGQTPPPAPSDAFGATSPWRGRIDLAGGQSILTNVPTFAFDGDAGVAWAEAIAPLWSSAPVAIAGITGPGPLFCLTELGRRHGMVAGERTLANGAILWLLQPRPSA